MLGGVPAARLALGLIHSQIQLLWMRVLKAPPPVLAALVDNEVDRLAHPLVPGDPRTPQILQRAQDVVEIAGWERERRKDRIDDLASRTPTEETPLKQIVLYRVMRDELRSPRIARMTSSGSHDDGLCRNRNTLVDPFLNVGKHDFLVDIVEQIVVMPLIQLQCLIS
jgi:hypothetical protein